MSRYLQYIKVERYGGLSDCEIGPLAPGLNVIYGSNEAGKSTVISLVGGVLFGWEGAHGVHDRYLPNKGGRAGYLVWDSLSESHTASTVLKRDEDNVAGDFSVIDDIDRATYEALFSLSADELHSLRSSSDVIARLLAAESGTAFSPASVFVQIERCIANSPLYQLEAQFEEVQKRIRQAGELERLHIQEDRELRKLVASRTAAAERMSILDTELEALIAHRTELETAEARINQLTDELEELRIEQSKLGFSGDNLEEDTSGDRMLANAQNSVKAAYLADIVIPSTIDAHLLSLDSASEHVLRDHLDELAEDQEKIRHAVSAAKENSTTSTAAYEALCEIDQEDVAESRRLRHRSSQVVVSVFLPLAFIAAGIPLFAHGRDIGSLSFTALGVGLLVVAVFLAFAAFFVLFRRPVSEDILEERRKNAQWVMLQDRKKLDSQLAEQVEFDAQISSFLQSAGLAAAEGSIRQARLLLDEAREVRMARAADVQKATSLDLRIRACVQELDNLLETVGDKKSAEVDQAIREKLRERDALLEASDNMSERFGELTRTLEAALKDCSFDQAKLEFQQLRTHLREARCELVVLLLAKRMLERSIAMWESQSQPEVNNLASRLLALITNGRWVRVDTSATGSLVAIDINGNAFDPLRLSLGTCQQLYLALRIALLIAIKDTGCAIPVLTDDILVNFDAERQRGAARALAELAARRQVIVFTCHEETVDILQENAPVTTTIKLSGEERISKTLSAF